MPETISVRATLVGVLTQAQELTEISQGLELDLPIQTGPDIMTPSHCPIGL